MGYIFNFISLFLSIYFLFFLFIYFFFFFYYYYYLSSLLKHEINKSIRNETSLGLKPKLLYDNIEEGNWNKKK